MSLDNDATNADILEDVHTPDLSKDKEEDTDQTENTRPKRGLPKTLLANKQKYLEVLEKQQRALSANKSRKKDKSSLTKTGKQKVSEIKKPIPTDNRNLRRVVVAGKTKYLPVQIPPKAQPASEEVVSDKNKYLSAQALPEENVSDQADNDEPVKRIPTAIAKKMELYQAQLAKENKTSKKTKPNYGSKSSHGIPSKYAKEMEKEIKKQTIKNVKNFSDLRRVRAIENLSPDADIDTNQASIAELRKIKIEQRKRDQADSKKKLEANKRESAVQEILKNDQMSKFAKAVAIKNLSANSRHRNILQRKKDAPKTEDSG